MRKKRRWGVVEDEEVMLEKLLVEREKKEKIS
jgi:hypothetical protein